MFDMEFADLEPLMSAGDMTDSVFLDISDTLRDDINYRQLQNDDQLLLITSTTSQVEPDEQTAAIFDYQTPSPAIGKKKTISIRNSSKSNVFHRPASRNAARERSRVKSLRCAFLDLQNSLPSVPPNTKLSKLDVLVLATTYIAHLMKVLDKPDVTVNLPDRSTDQFKSSPYTALLSSEFFGEQNSQQQQQLCLKAKSSWLNTAERHQHRLQEKGYLHPVRKWPMRSRLYAGAIDDKNSSQLQLPTFTTFTKQE